MYNLGIDLGGTNIKAGIVDTETGKILIKDSSPTPVAEGPDAIAEAIACLCRKIVSEFGIEMTDIASAGIGSPGSCDIEAGVVIFANNLKLDNYPIGPILEKKLGLKKVYVENDANVAAKGEAAYGASKGCRDSVMITLGTGLGGGIIANGELITGVNCAGGELGHITLVVDGLECTCGRRGCWETYSSATALVNMTKKKMEGTTKADTCMWELAEKEGKVSARTAFDALRLGDQLGKEVVDEFVHYLAEGIISVINIFQPEVFVIGGGVCNEKDYLVKPLIEYVNKYQYYHGDKPKTQIKVALLGNDAGLVGAAMLGL